MGPITMPPMCGCECHRFGGAQETACRACPCWETRTTTVPEAPPPPEPRGERGAKRLANSFADPIETAEEFARRCHLRDRKRDHQLRWERERLTHDARSQRIWATVVAAIFLGALALIAFIVYAVTTEHAREKEAQIKSNAGKVYVWCYADPNTDGASSEVYGYPDDVRDYCPDAHRVLT